MALTDTAIRTAKPTDKLRKLSDSGGLQLHIAPTGSKLWRWAYRHDGKQKVMALGAYPEITLAQAREQRDTARKLLAMGTDPMAKKKADKVAATSANANTFEAVARDWWAHWKSDRSDNHTQYVIRRLEADVFPAIGKRPISAIEAPDLVTMVKKVSARGASDIAKRLLQTTAQVFRFVYKLDDSRPIG